MTSLRLFRFGVVVTAAAVLIGCQSLPISDTHGYGSDAGAASGHPGDEAADGEWNR